MSVPVKMAPRWSHQTSEAKTWPSEGVVYVVTVLDELLKHVEYLRRELRRVTLRHLHRPLVVEEGHQVNRPHIKYTNDKTQARCLLKAATFVQVASHHAQLAQALATGHLPHAGPELVLSGIMWAGRVVIAGPPGRSAAALTSPCKSEGHDLLV